MCIFCGGLYRGFEEKRKIKNYLVHPPIPLPLPPKKATTIFVLAWGQLGTLPDFCTRKLKYLSQEEFNVNASLRKGLSF
jgi:hypothetical protein